MVVDKMRKLFAGKFGEPLCDDNAKEKRPYFPYLYVEVLRAFCTFVNGDEPLQPLTVIGVRRGGLPRHEGIYDDDIVVKINDIPVKGMRLREAQLMIRKSGRFVRVLVKDEADDAINEDLLNQSRNKYATHDWEQIFPWNDIEKPIYHESNCHMVPSQALLRMQRARELAELIEEQRQQQELKRLANLVGKTEAKVEETVEEEKEESIPSSPIPECIRLYELFDTIFYLQKREPCSCEHVTYLVYKTQLPDINEKHVKFNL
ncbi:uncharacterized protein LOC129809140 [Phlebotomus papatasi]|uniref:uncharacterized protein LOC129809140 n=1 Tax=Phlebotomus papatasi TaxID=29031 RepID=UPI00248334B8|nr:uncharacterized protein LOC129809140 [Phlebotomus papatasi]